MNVLLSKFSGAKSKGLEAENVRKDDFGLESAATTRKPAAELTADIPMEETASCLDVQEPSPQVEVEMPRKKLDRGPYLCVLVHATDRLKTKIYISHPVVKVHLLEKDTGRSIQGWDGGGGERFGESGAVRPQKTKACNFREKRLPYPKWEETLVFNVPVAQLFSRNSNALLIFEILDSLQLSSKSPETSKDVWVRIAWAFLQVGARFSEGLDKIGRNLRLQLFKAPKNFAKDESDFMEPYTLWKSLRRVLYPGTLYVSIKGIDLKCLPKIQPEVQVAKAHQVLPEPTNQQNHQSEQDLERRQGVAEDAQPERRIRGQPCKIPNSPMAALTGPKLWTLRVRFSNDGRFIATAGKNSQTEFPIFIHQIPSGRELTSLWGHVQAVYDLCWSTDSSLLLSSSGDSTARIWELRSGFCIHVFPHVTFVYAGLFHPTASNLSITSSFDRTIRLWRRSSGTEGELVQELKESPGYVNCMRLSSDGSRLFSGDSEGEIGVWTVGADSVTFLRAIKPRQLQGKMLNQLLIHPTEPIIFVQARDGTIRSLDLRTSALKQSFEGANFDNLHAQMELSPCGRYLFSSGERHSVIVWAADNGKEVATFETFLHDPSALVASISFHPFKDIIAFGLCGEGLPIRLLSYDQSSLSS